MAAETTDVVHIAPGRYEEAVDTNKRLQFVGAGSGPAGGFPDTTQHTYMQGAVATGFAAMRLRNGGSVTGMRIAGAENGVNEDGLPALMVQGPAAVAVSRMVLEGGAATETARFSGASLDVQAGATVTVTDSVLDTFKPAGATLLVAGTVDVSRTSILARGPGGAGVFTNDGGTTTLTDVQVTGEGSLGAYARNMNGAPGSTSRLSVIRSRVSAPSSALAVIASMDRDAVLDVRDSLAVSAFSAPVGADTNVVSVSANTAGRARLTAVGSTFVASGPGADAGIFAFAFGSGPNVSSATLTNTVVRATDTDGTPTDADLRADGAGATFTASSSSFSDAVVAARGTAPAPGSGTNIAGDPGLAADFTLGDGSPLIDRGDPGAVTAGELDLAGAARSLDGDGNCEARPDIGAFERTARTCVPTGGGGPGPGPGPGGGGPGPPGADTVAPVFTGALTATNKTFRVGTPAAARSAAAKRGTRLRYTLSEAASVRFTVERKTTGRRVGGTCRKATSSNRKRPRCTIWVPQGSPVVAAVAGANSTPFSGRIGRKTLKPGSYRIRAVATDAARNRSAEKRVNVKIVRR